jgi:hypothetical protein
MRFPQNTDLKIKLGKPFPAQFFDFKEVACLIDLNQPSGVSLKSP